MIISDIYLAQVRRSHVDPSTKTEVQRKEVIYLKIPSKKIRLASAKCYNCFIGIS